jgi:hypothetical protein
MDEGPLHDLLMVIVGAIVLNAMRYDPVPFGDATTLAIAGLPVLMIGWGLFDLGRAALKRLHREREVGIGMTDLEKPQVSIAKIDKALLLGGLAMERSW